MLILAVENSASMLFHQQTLYDLYIDQLLDNYLEAGPQRAKKNAPATAKRLVLFSSFPSGKIHFKSGEKAKIKDEFGKLEMTNGQSKTVTMNTYIKNLHSCIKQSLPAGEIIHLVFVTCSIPILNHTLHGKASVESLISQELANLASVSVISPFTKNLMSACRKMQNPEDTVNHANLFLYFHSMQQNLLLENNQYSVLLHPSIAKMIKLKTSNAAAGGTVPKNAPFSVPPSAPLVSNASTAQNIKQQPISAPISAPSPSAYPPPTKFTKDSGMTPPNTGTQASITKASPAIVPGKMTNPSPAITVNNPILIQQQQINANDAASVAAMSANINSMQQKQQQQKNPTPNIQQNTPQIQMSSLLVNSAQQQQQQQMNMAAQQQMKGKQSPFIPQGSLLGQPQIQQQQQKILQQQQLQMKNMYQPNQVQVQVDPSNNNTNSMNIANTQQAMNNFAGNNNFNNMMNQGNAGVGNMNMNSAAMTHNIQLQQHLMMQQQMGNNAGMANQMQMGNNNAFIGGVNPFANQAAGNMIQQQTQQQMQMQRSVVWSGACKFLVPPNNTLVFMASAIPQRNRNAADYALNSWPQALSFEQYVVCPPNTVEMMANQDKVMAFVLLPSQQSGPASSILINHLAQSSQGAIARFANTTSGIMVIPRQSQLFAFLFLQDNLLDQAIEKISGAQGVNVNMNQQGVMNNMNQQGVMNNMNQQGVMNNMNQGNMNAINQQGAMNAMNPAMMAQIQNLSPQQQMQLQLLYQQGGMNAQQQMQLQNQMAGLGGGNAGQMQNNMTPQQRMQLMQMQQRQGGNNQRM